MRLLLWPFKKTGNTLVLFVLLVEMVVMSDNYEREQNSEFPHGEQYFAKRPPSTKDPKKYYL